MDESSTSYTTTTKNILETIPAKTNSSDSTAVFAASPTIYVILTAYSIVIAFLLIFKCFDTLSRFKKYLDLYTITAVIHPIVTVIFFIVSEEHSFNVKYKILMTALFLIDMIFFIIFFWVLSIPRSRKLIVTFISAALSACLIASIASGYPNINEELHSISWFFLALFKIAILIVLQENPNRLIDDPGTENENNSRVDPNYQTQLDRMSDFPPKYNDVFGIPDVECIMAGDL